MLEGLFTPAALISLLTLSLLEIVLGIDNIIFISIVASKLPHSQQARARQVGLVLALAVRILLLSFISYITGMTEPLLTFMDKGFSGRDIILLIGGLFLIGKTISEIHHTLQGASLAAEDEEDRGKKVSFGGTIVQIILVDIVFSFDSILTAVGLSKQLPVMISAVIISMIVMMIFSGVIAGFIERNPTIKMIALAFLVVIGVLLVAEAFGQEVDKGLIYFALAFSLGIELLNMTFRKRSRPKHLTDTKLMDGKK